VDAGGGADLIGMMLQLGAAGEWDTIQVINRLEMPVDQDRVGQRPQVLGRLQFGQAGRQKQQVGAIRFLETAR
jgi:hypothetical protein